MFKLTYIGATWCNSCSDIKSNIKPFLDKLNKEEYQFMELDMDDDEDTIEKMNVEITKLPSLVVADGNSNEIKVIPNKNIKTYLESLLLVEDDDF